MVCSCSTTQNKFEYKSIVKLRNIEKSGIKHYKKQNYKQAYEKFIVSAKWGLKHAQYFLGVMYLKGQYVKQSTLVGTAWVGVANEQKVVEWDKTYNEVYQMLTDEQKTRIDKEVKIYISKYGLKANELDCSSNPAKSPENYMLFCKVKSISKK